MLGPLLSLPKKKKTLNQEQQTVKNSTHIASDTIAVSAYPSFQPWEYLHVINSATGCRRKWWESDINQETFLFCSTEALDKEGNRKKIHSSPAP